jgi:RND family efflux transporter MFP subunit
MKGVVSRVVVPVLAVAGIGYATYYSTVVADRPPPPPNQLALPAETEFASSVSGSGLIEASSRNIDVGSFLSGIVAEVAVLEGQRVKRGDLLFVLDTRAARAELAVAEQDVAEARAGVAQGQAELGDREDQLRRSERLVAGVSVSEDRVARQQFAVRTARAQLEAARAAVGVAEARVAAARVMLDRLSVHAPIAGRVLKVGVRPGEFVVAGPAGTPYVLLGEDHPLHVRVQVDENDLWRLDTARLAEAVMRGNRDIRFPLTFVRIEPWVLPKRSLTGDTTERVDTRVLELIYSFEPGDRQVFIGQQVDVFIEAEPRPGS